MSGVLEPSHPALRRSRARTSHHATGGAQAERPAPTTPARADSAAVRRAAQFPLVLGGAVAASVIVVAREWLGARVPAGWNWGVNAFAFLPGYALPLATLLAVLVAAIAWRGRRTDADPRPLGLALLPLSVLAGVAFWLLRSRHLLLGDAIMVARAPSDWSIPPLEPLSGVLVQMFWRFVGGLPVEALRPADAVAWDAAALGSCVAGALVVGLTPGLVRRLAGVGPRTPMREGEVRTGFGDATPWVIAAFLLQGWLVLVCGYPETYGYLLVGLIVYLRCCTAVADGARPLRDAGLALLVAIGLHLSAFALAPSFAYLAWRRLADPRTRRRAWRDLGIVAAVGGGLVAVLAVALQGNFLPATLLETARDVMGGVGQEVSDGRPHWAHLVDQINGQMLIGPLAAGFFALTALVALRRWTTLTPRHHVLLLCGLAMLGITLIAGDSNLGYARNWDLIAPWAMVMTACGLALLPLLMPDARHLRRALIALAMASAVHTAGWVAVNASESASLARFATLPLGMGRVESTLGYWYLTRGDHTRAEQWLARSLDANPANLRAHYHFAQLYMAQRRYAQAAQAYRSVVALRPKSVEYGLDLADALRRGGDLEGAAAECRRLLALDPHAERARILYGAVLMDLGRAREARDVLGDAL